MKALTIDIRRAEPRDAEPISEVHHAAWRGAYSGIIPHRALNAMLQRRGPQWWRRAISRSAYVLVADCGGTISGYATLGPNRARLLPQQGEVYELYIRPEYQGVGLGSRLFSSALRRLAEQGLKGAVVWALADNDIALAFYRGAGGRDVAEGVETFDGKALKKIAFTWA
jgi:ribosomal protein S18 acetylase RimI-like enzyme